MKMINNIYHKLVPINIRHKLSPVLNFVWVRIHPTTALLSKQTIANVQEIKSVSKINKSVISILWLMRNTRMQIWFFSCCIENTDILRRYMKRDICPIKDNNNGMNYIVIDGKKIYFERKHHSNTDAVVSYFNEISYEQNYRSPHRYFSNDRYFIGVDNEKNIDITEKDDSFGVEEGDVVLDLGSAEETFALSVADIAKKVYIVECNEAWCEALRETFRPYGSKIEIVEKYISNKNTATTITIDTILNQHEHVGERVFIKMDLEGCEEAAIEGAMNTLKNTNNIRVALCTYHRSQDAELFSGILIKLGFNVCLTDGWIAYPCESSELRKALLRAYKRQPDKNRE